MYKKYCYYNTLALQSFILHSKEIISNNRSVEYNFYLPHYKLFTEITLPEDSGKYHVCIKVAKIHFKNNELVESNTITPHNFSKFNTFPIFNDIFAPNQIIGQFDCFDVDIIIDKICQLLKILFKIDDLVVFT